jgi:hypothetical protein
VLNGTVGFRPVAAALGCLSVGAVRIEAMGISKYFQIKSEIILIVESVCHALSSAAFMGQLAQGN